MTISGFHDVMICPEGVIYIVECSHIMDMICHKILICASCEHSVHNGRHFRSGDRAVRLKGVVLITVDPAIIRRSQNRIIEPINRRNVFEGNVSVIVCLGKARSNCRKFASGDNSIRVIHLVADTIEDAQRGQRIYRRGEPCILGNIHKVRGDGNILAAQQIIEHLRHFRSGHAAVRAKLSIAVAVHIGVMQCRLQKICNTGLLRVGHIGLGGRCRLVVYDGRHPYIGIARSERLVGSDRHSLHLVGGVYLARGVARELPAVEAVSAVGCDSGHTGDREAFNDYLTDQRIARVGETSVCSGVEGDRVRCLVLPYSVERDGSVCRSHHCRLQRIVDGRARNIVRRGGIWRQAPTEEVLGGAGEGICGQLEVCCIVFVGLRTDRAGGARQVRNIVDGIVVGIILGDQRNILALFDRHAQIVFLCSVFSFQPQQVYPGFKGSLGVG